MEAAVAAVSFGQRRLWLLDHLEPGNAAYYITSAVRLRGTLDRAAVEEALRTVSDRHEAMRTTFGVENGEPVQIIRDPAPWSLPVIGIGTEEELEARLSEEARRHFDLANGPVWRAVLFARSADDHVLQFTLHHIAGDAWSLRIFLREFAACYRARISGGSVDLPELPLQYADFADWQNEAAKSAAISRQVDEIRKHLEGAPTVLELPTDRVRPAVQSHRGARLVRRLPDDLIAALRELGRREGATLFMTLLAVFEVLLLRWTRQEDLLIGSPVAGRSQSSAEGVVGFFVNTIVLRADLAGDPTFAELLARVREECLGAFGRQEVPFERVVEALRLPRDRRRTPVFQVFFSMQSVPRGALELPGLKATTIEVDTGAARTDLSLALEESPAGIFACWEHCTEVIAPAAAATMADGYENLLAAAARGPGRRISALPWLAQDERARIVQRGGEPGRDFLRPLSLGAWFSRQAARTPNRIAVGDETGTISYRELDRWSNRLARHLRGRGVGPETSVGLCLGRSAELVACVLGILKAGGAYVPIDPAYPRERIEYLLQDSAPVALLTRGETPGADYFPRVDLAQDAAAIDAESPEPLPEVVGPDHAAYIIYTSGSTGLPKGCVVTHGNVTRLMAATEDWFCFGPDDVWTLFHSFAFDFSVWEIWGALLYGGRLVVVPNGVSRSPEAFHGLLEREGVSVLNQTPSAFRPLIAAAAKRGKTLALRHVIFGGEALEPAMLAPWFDLYEDTVPRVTNMYGITETTVHVTYRAITRSDAVPGGASVIGTRLPDLTLHLIDSQFEPVPPGVPGEIAVGGAGLARGYLHRPDLTAERFVPNPFGPGRLYRSGDLARWRADGELEYLGRIDNQVKVRGYRIELGEIERVLASLAGVEACAVLAREDRPGERRLVAYLVRRPGVTGIDVLAARELCRARLPDPMVPAAFVFIENFPLTAHGKLDRRALPVPDAGAAVAAEFEAPATPTEQALAAVWSKVLGIPRVGRKDNFFALGGDSILSIQVASLAAKSGYRLAPSDLFETRTLAELGSVATLQAAPAGPRAAKPSSSSADIEDEYPLAPMQAGILFHSVYEPGTDVYFEQVWGELRGPLDPAAFRGAWQGLVNRHPALRTSFVWRDGKDARQIVHKRAELPWSEDDWSGRTDSEIAEAWEKVLTDERSRGFELGSAPLMRVVLTRVGTQRWRWLWSHHHLLLDGWSLPRVFRDVLADYEFRVGGGQPPQPGLPYRPYVDWVRSQDATAAERYWREAMRGWEGRPLAILPPPPSGRPAIPAEVELRISREESDALRAWVRSREITLNTLFQGAWAWLLSRYGAGEDVGFGVTVSGRPPELPGVESIIGLFINTLPLRVRVDPASATVPWLRALQAAQSRMRQFGYSALGDIKEWSGAPRGRPLFESILVFENYPVEEDLRGLGSGLQLEGLRTRERTNYPLTAAVVPGEELVLKLNFDSHRFLPGTVIRMLRHWRELAVSATLPTADLLGGLAMLGKDETAQTLGRDRSAGGVPPPGCIHWLVTDRAKQAPLSPALLGPGQVISYAEMEARANRLAHLLRGMGVGPEVRVAICMEKSPELVVAYLGVLKAGGAFVPLDPRFARERLAFAVEDARPALLLFHEPTAWTAALAAVPSLSLDSSEVDLAAQPSVDPAVAVDPANLAYVIHTSGSTGRPKGAMLTHAGLCHFARELAAATGLGPGQRVLQFASISFDASVDEIFTALVSGAALWLEGGDAVPDPRAFARMAAVARIDHATLPPALLGALDPSEFPLLRTLLVAGEAAPDSLYRQWGKGRRLFNAYGPTETTVCASLAEIGPETDSVTIGRPLGQTVIYILDGQLNLAPPGVSGEICIGGVGVGRGYLGRPDLTAERFVPDPFAKEPGTRLYRSGDLGRGREDGRIDYLGRNDRQVKIRGFRVEPTEVESALGSHSGVAASLALASDDPSGGKFLLAYALLRPGCEASPAELKGHLEGRLPDYLVPRHVLILQAWPMTTSGKIDRKALPLPESGQRPLPESSPLVGAVETALAQIWQDVLRVTAVGPDDNFFDLGGDSIVSLQIVSRAQRSGIEITPRQIFDTPTVRGLAARAKQHAAAVAADGADGEEIPLMPIQHWFFGQNQPDVHHWNQSVVLEFSRDENPELLAQALNAVMAHHGAFRLRFRRDQTSKWRQVYGRAASPEEIPRYPGCMLEEKAHLLQASLDLTDGPLWRAAWFAGDPGEPPRLLLIVHHLAVDGVSWRILAEDLVVACAQLKDGKRVALAPNGSSYGRWARAIATRAASAPLRDELPYWRQVLGVDGSLPRDFPADPGAASVEAAELLSITLDAATTTSLLREAPASSGMRADEILLAALAGTLAGWTGRPATRIHRESHGRHDPGDGIDLTRTVGWFTSLHPLVLEAGRDMAPAAQLKAARRSLRSVPGHGIGFGALAHLCPDEAVRRELAGCSAPEACFNYLGQTDSSQGPAAPFALADVQSGPSQSVLGRRPHLLDINCIVVGGCLRMDWIFSGRAHRRATIVHLSDDFAERLRRLVGHASVSGPTGPAPSDFAHVRINAGELDSLLADLEDQTAGSSP